MLWFKEGSHLKQVAQGQYMVSRVGRTYVVTVEIESHTPWCQSFDIMVNKAGYTATEVACRWAVVIFEIILA